MGDVGNLLRGRAGILGKSGKSSLSSLPLGRFGVVDFAVWVFSALGAGLIRFLSLVLVVKERLIADHGVMLHILVTVMRAVFAPKLGFAFAGRVATPRAVETPIVFAEFTLPLLLGFWALGPMMFVGLARVTTETRIALGGLRVLAATLFLFLTLQSLSVRAWRGVR